MSQSELFTSGDEADIEDLGGGLRRQMLGYNHELMAVKIYFEKGAIGYNHAHRHSQVCFVVEGEFHFNIDGITTIMKAGDSCVIQPWKDHGATCPSGGVLIDMFSPPREDFLPTGIFDNIDVEKLNSKPAEIK